MWPHLFIRSAGVSYLHITIISPFTITCQQERFCHLTICLPFPTCFLVWCVRSLCYFCLSLPAYDWSRGRSQPDVLLRFLDAYCENLTGRRPPHLVDLRYVARRCESWFTCTTLCSVTDAHSTLRVFIYCMCFFYAKTVTNCSVLGWQTNWWHNFDTKGPRFTSARFFFVISHVSLLHSVCGLPQTSRRSWVWSPGSNPKQEAVLWALLFPPQGWVLTFSLETMTSADSVRNASQLCFCTSWVFTNCCLQFSHLTWLKGTVQNQNAFFFLLLAVVPLIHGLFWRDLLSFGDIDLHICLPPLKYDGTS